MSDPTRGREPGTDLMKAGCALTLLTWFGIPLALIAFAAFLALWDSLSDTVRAVIGFGFLLLVAGVFLLLVAGVMASWTEKRLAEKRRTPLASPQNSAFPRGKLRNPPQKSSPTTAPRPTSLGTAPVRRTKTELMSFIRERRNHDKELAYRRVAQSLAKHARAYSKQLAPQGAPPEQQIAAAMEACGYRSDHEAYEWLLRTYRNSAPPGSRVMAVNWTRGTSSSAEGYRSADIFCEEGTISSSTEPDRGHGAGVSGFWLPGRRTSESWKVARYECHFIPGELGWKPEEMVHFITVPGQPWPPSGVSLEQGARLNEEVAQLYPWSQSTAPTTVFPVWRGASDSPTPTAAYWDLQVKKLVSGGRWQSEIYWPTPNSLSKPTYLVGPELLGAIARDQLTA